MAKQLDVLSTFKDITLKKKSAAETRRPLGYERVYLPLCKVADTPFHTQGAEMMCVIYS